MSERPGLSGSLIDIVIVVFSVGVLLGSVTVWMASATVSREIVFVTTTVALVISLVLVISVAALVVVRLHRRVARLEQSLNNRDERLPAVEPSVVVVTLTNIERRILNRLEENDGIIAQDELRRVTGLSKSTLSVSLSSLERKGLIRRETRGRTKIVQMVSSVRR